MSAKASYKVLFVKLSGNVKVSMKNLTVGLTFKLDKYDNGKG
jgi:hypothetical protein